MQSSKHLWPQPLTKVGQWRQAEPWSSLPSQPNNKSVSFGFSEEPHLGNREWVIQEHTWMLTSGLCMLTYRCVQLHRNVCAHTVAFWRQSDPRATYLPQLLRICWLLCRQRYDQDSFDFSIVPICYNEEIYFSQEVERKGNKGLVLRKRKQIGSQTQTAYLEEHCFMANLKSLFCKWNISYCRRAMWQYALRSQRTAQQQSMKIRTQEVKAAHGGNWDYCMYRDQQMPSTTALKTPIQRKLSLSLSLDIPASSPPLIATQTSKSAPDFTRKACSVPLLPRTQLLTLRIERISSLKNKATSV